MGSGTLARRSWATMVSILGLARVCGIVDGGCRRCGYGVRVSGELPLCPICQRRSWQPIPVARASSQGVQL
jgi:hypothetical protein